MLGNVTELFLTDCPERISDLSNCCLHGSLRGDQKAWGWQVAMQSTQTTGLSFMAFFFFSPSLVFFFPLHPPLLIADFQQFGLSNSPSALSPSPKNGKPVQLIHREASRRWIFGIEAVLPTRAGREPRPPMVLRAKWKAIPRVGCLEQHSFLATCHQAFSLCQLGIFTWKVMSLDYFHSMWLGSYNHTLIKIGTAIQHFINQPFLHYVLHNRNRWVSWDGPTETGDLLAKKLWQLDCRHIKPHTLLNLSNILEREDLILTPLVGTGSSPKNIRHYPSICWSLTFSLMT